MPRCGNGRLGIFSLNENIYTRVMIGRLEIANRAVFIVDDAEHIKVIKSIKQNVRFKGCCIVEINPLRDVLGYVWVCACSCEGKRTPRRCALRLDWRLLLLRNGETFPGRFSKEFTSPCRIINSLVANKLCWRSHLNEKPCELQEVLSGMGNAACLTFG